ncbi:MAG TPA: pyrimidine-nucleoside phosphorylase [Sediminispirochaeta sp.]|nr:pyrimidine-nucleoside phosphorylase [Sediminispirochaeta sp.]
MRMVDIIEKKRNGEALSTEEIGFFIKGYSTGSIPDYQAAALLMAIWFRGMDKRETTDLTLAMVDSGDKIDLSSIPGIKVDKHSTGGVADTTTLVVGPLVAAAGGHMAKMSGRGLGHTGGTLDKLESVPGLSIDQSMEDFARIVKKCGFSVIGQTGNLVPADKQLYALRDVTGTIDNVSLIAGSIMSKKIAAGADRIVLDVKTGSGAFMRRLEDARRLADMMVEIGNLAGKPTHALVTDMNQPLGNAVGNALEVEEAIMILRGEVEGDLKTVSFALAQKMLLLGEVCSSEDEALDKLEQAISSGEALKRLACMFEQQGGDPRVVEDTSLLPHAREIIPVRAESSGYITEMETADLGVCALLLGAGRSKKEDTIDPAVGYWMKKRLGQRVDRGDVIAEFHVNSRENLEEAVAKFQQAVKIGEKSEVPPTQSLYS